LTKKLLTSTPKISFEFNVVEFNDTERAQIQDAKQNLVDCIKRMVQAGYPKQIVAEAFIELLQEGK
jgi:hypothetical protein